MPRKPVEFVGHPFSFPDVMSYPGVCKHIVDGDTIDVFVSVGLNKYAYETIRILGIMVGEMKSKNAAEKKRAQAAKKFLEELLLGQPVQIRTRKAATTFERFVADVIYVGSDGNERSVADTLRAAGHAKLGNKMGE